MKRISRLSPLIGLITASVLSAQGVLERDLVPLKNWDAPMYWQPNAAESKEADAKQLLAGNAAGDRTSSITAQAQTPANSLVFVGMTPCRVVDTRGAVGLFGGPALIGGTHRTFPIPSSANCSISSIAQAYSFNITIVPPVGGFLDFVTVGPTPISQLPPTFSTLNGYVCAFSSLPCALANAAIVPAGTSGSVDVYASQSTNLIIDINGYYAAQSGITLAQGTAGAPSLSFAADPGTGIFSSGAGKLDISTGGTARLSVLSNGSMTVTGNLGISGNVGIGTPDPDGLQIGAAVSESPRAVDNVRFGVNLGSPRAIFEDDASATQWEIDNSGGRFRIYTPGVERFTIDPSGNVGIGMSPSDSAKLQVQGINDFGVSVSGRYTGVRGVGESRGVDGFSSNGVGVSGNSDTYHGVQGHSTNSAGVAGYSENSFGVLGASLNNWAGFFSGNVYVTGTLTQSSDARLKQDVTNLGYGLREVLQLRPVTWNWKDKPNRGPQLGLIAQEVETVLPELVSTDKDADQTKGLNYIGLVPVTINAIQQQQAQIEDQEKRLEQQQRQIDSLKLLVCLDHPDSVVCN